MTYKIITIVLVFLFTGGCVFFFWKKDDLIEPILKMQPQPLSSTNKNPPRVALSLDACRGQTDWRLLEGLIQNNIPATLFVTQRWLIENEESVERIRSYPDLFELENHGKNHIPPVDREELIYGLKSAGTMEAVIEEVLDGAKAIVDRGFPQPKWYRGATAKYTHSAIKKIQDLGFKIAGYSLNGDEGTTLKREQSKHRIEQAVDGDVIISHMNHPQKEAGQGVLEGVLALKQKGYVFVKFSQNQNWIGEDGTIGQ